MNSFEVCRQSIQLLIENPLIGNRIEELASRFQLTSNHFQKVFKQHVGVTPKQFQQCLLVNLARPNILKQSLLSTSEALALSSPSRLYDAFVQIDAMSPGEFKSLGNQLHFRYATEHSLLGELIVVCTDRGIHYMGFVNDDDPVIAQLKSRYPNARFSKYPENSLLGCDPFNLKQPIQLHVSATNFQVQVWQALLKTQKTQLTCYSDIAKAINKPKGARSVGQAVGANPVAILIPCHRVIKQSGLISGYRWGENNKLALLALELTSDS